MLQGGDKRDKRDICPPCPASPEGDRRDKTPIRGLSVSLWTVPGARIPHGTRKQLIATFLARFGANPAPHLVERIDLIALPHRLSPQSPRRARRHRHRHHHASASQTEDRRHDHAEIAGISTNLAHRLADSGRQREDRHLCHGPPQPSLPLQPDIQAISRLTPHQMLAKWPQRVRLCVPGARRCLIATSTPNESTATPESLRGYPVSAKVYARADLSLRASFKRTRVRGPRSLPPRAARRNARSAQCRCCPQKTRTRYPVPPEPLRRAVVDLSTIYPTSTRKC